MNKKLSNLMLLANLLSTLFYSMSYPYIYAELVKVVSRQYITFEQIISCIGVVVFSTIWNKYGDKLFNYYKKIVFLEIIADMYLFIDVLIRNDLKFYFILNVIIYSVITKNMCCGGIRMRAKVHPDEKDREKYDNNSNTISAIATLVGSAFALFFGFEIKTLFILAMIGNVIDNFIYLYIYSKLQIQNKKEYNK